MKMADGITTLPGIRDVTPELSHTIFTDSDEILGPPNHDFNFFMVARIYNLFGNYHTLQRTSKESYFHYPRNNWSKYNECFRS